MTFEVIENTEDRTGETVIRRKIYELMIPSIQSDTDTPYITAFSMARAPFSGTTTRTRPPGATNATHPTASKKSSSAE